MTSAALLDRPPVRRRDAAATRAAILAAARAQFARAGYEGAYLRDIAAEAGADAALINRYFGGKEGLFAQVLQGAIRSDKLFSGERAAFGRHVARVFADRLGPQTETGLEAYSLILRAAVSQTTAPLLSTAVEARFMGPIAAWLGGEAAHVRARLISSIFIGLLVERLIRNEPLPDAERGPFIERLAAILQSLVDG